MDRTQKRRVILTNIVQKVAFIILQTKELTSVFFHLQICAHMSGGAVRSRNLKLTKGTLLEVVKSKVEEHNRTLDVLAKGYAYVHKEGSPSLPGTPAGAPQKNSPLGMSSSTRMDMLRASLGEYANPANININISNNNLQHENTIGLVQQQPSKHQQAPPSNVPNGTDALSDEANLNNPTETKKKEGSRSGEGLAEMFGTAVSSNSPKKPPTGKGGPPSVPSVGSAPTLQKDDEAGAANKHGATTETMSTSNPTSGNNAPAEHFSIGSPSDLPTSPPNPNVLKKEPWYDSPDKNSKKGKGKSTGPPISLSSEQKSVGLSTGTGVSDESKTGVNDSTDTVSSSSEKKQSDFTPTSLPNASVNAGMPSIYSNTNRDSIPNQQGFAKKKPKEAISSPFGKKKDTIHDI